jgi:hypothetical protein
MKRLMYEAGTAALLLVGFMLVIITLEGATRSAAITLTIVAMVAHLATVLFGDNE